MRHREPLLRFALLHRRLIKEDLQFGYAYVTNSETMAAPPESESSELYRLTATRSVRGRDSCFPCDFNQKVSKFI